MPEQVRGRTFHRSRFDRFAEAASGFAGQGVFFAGCVGVLVVWLASYLAISDPNTWELIINTVTTIITFLLVALLQNAQHRDEVVQQTKLNAIADALADLMEHQATGDLGDLMTDMEDLRSAAGLEEHA